MWLLGEIGSMATERGSVTRSRLVRTMVRDFATFWL